jgi:catechol 2,3-dioxygenase-like lactoylglutathione lyase family enzyme
MPDFTGSQIDHLNDRPPQHRRPRSGPLGGLLQSVLATLDIVTLLEIPEDTHEPRPAMHGFGRHPKPFFWLIADGRVGDNMHLAFTAKDRPAVDAFHKAALSAGATSRIKPGLRPDYHPDYYGAFVNAPAGINLEAVCHHAPA